MGSEVSFGGYAGKSLAQKMRDKTDELYDEWMAYTGPDADIHQGRIEGACEMMAILTSTNSDLQWESTEARYADRERIKARNKAKELAERSEEINER